MIQNTVHIHHTRRYFRTSLKKISLIFLALRALTSTTRPLLFTFRTAAPFIILRANCKSSRHILHSTTVILPNTELISNRNCPLLCSCTTVNSSSTISAALLGAPQRNLFQISLPHGLQISITKNTLFHLSYGL